MIPPALPPISPLDNFTPSDALSSLNTGGSSASLPGAAQSAGGGSFAAELSGAINQMQQMQSNATSQVQALVHGNSQDVHASMIAVEKADLAFGLMLQLRNKAVEAYQDISHMSF